MAVLVVAAISIAVTRLSRCGDIALVLVYGCIEQSIGTVGNSTEKVKRAGGKVNNAIRTEQERRTIDSSSGYAKKQCSVTVCFFDFVAAIASASRFLTK